MQLLPRVYSLSPNSPPEYAKFVGMPKLSYSQYNSWKDTKYFDDYIRHYFFGLPPTTNAYAQFGSAVGEYFEKLEIDQQWLSANDVSILQKVERRPGVLYESEIVIDRGWYCIQGFADEELRRDNIVDILDTKTGSVNSKLAWYAHKTKYFQTRMYTYGRENEGFTPGDCEVRLLDRLGSDRSLLPHAKLRLSGRIEMIPTPYVRSEVEELLLGVDKVAEEIKEYFKIFQKIKR